MIASLAKDIAKNGDVVLDIGAGVGVSTWTLSSALRNKKDVQVVGLDVFEWDRLNGRSPWHPQTAPGIPYAFFQSLRDSDIPTPSFIRGSIFALDEQGAMIAGLPVKDESVDIAVLCQVLRYIPIDHGEKVTQELERVLKPGGSAIIYEEYAPIVLQKTI